MQPVVRVNGLTQHIHNKLVLDEVSFQVNPGELFVLYGPSGSGKTTLLSVLAGLQAYRSGTVTTPDKSHTGLVTQDYSLFINFSVAENLTVIGSMRGIPSHTLDQRLDEVVETLQLQDYLRLKPRHLPWGPRQRLALACAMLHQPQLLLLDDILSRGDAESSRLLVNTVQKYVAGGNSCIWATGRPHEALNLCGLKSPDEQEASSSSQPVGLMEQGRLVRYNIASFRKWLYTNSTDMAGWEMGGGQ